MKIFDTEELKTREELKKLTFDVKKSSDMFEDENHDFYVEFYDEDGYLYDGGELWYHFQDEFKDKSLQGELDNPVEGVLIYDGQLTKADLIEFFKKIGFEQD